MDGVNIYRSQLVTHTFHVFLYAAKACLLPFLTLYFRQLGLTATQTGCIIGAKAACSVLGGGFWATCAIKCNKRRLMLMLSVFITLASFLFLTVVPPINKTIEMEFCNGSYLRNNNSIDNMKLPYNESTVNDILKKFNQTDIVTPPSTTVIITEAPPDIKDSLALPSKSAEINPKKSSSTNGPTTTIPTTIVTRSATITKSAEPNAKERANQAATNFWDSLSEDERDLFREFGFGREKFLHMTPEEYNEIRDMFDSSLQSRRKRSEEENKDMIGRMIEGLNSQVTKLQESMQATQYATLIGVIVLMLATEMLVAPTEKLADAYWFELVDVMDVLERYGSHKIWATIGFALTPLIVTALVDRTPCIMGLGMNHFLIHFYSYAALMGLVFVCAIFYPVLKNPNTIRKVNRYTRLSTGLGIMFGDCHAFGFTITILITGFVTAAMDNFMFWMMQDLGSKEIYMGGTVVLAAVGEIIVFVFSKLLIKRISNAGAVILGLFVLTLRLLLFSFMWEPWMALPIGLFHGLSNTLLWASVESYSDFKVNPFIMDRSAKSVMQAMYTAIGFAGGSVASGILYDKIGLSLVLQGSAILVFSWCVIFMIVHRCAPKKHRVRYAKLLQAEEDRITDSSDDEDWLEVALKTDKTH